ncbi:MAG TPA: hypothetical protein PKJ34_01915 [Anaerolineaceae bacterium]|nr:hypothetical protein [Anaerolineaceae bacterium]HOH18889.1 hypothetical protein [Anaerolineaceae bacterium]
MRIVKQDLTFFPDLAQVIDGSVGYTTNTFLVNARSRGLSPNTIRDYSNEIKTLIIFLNQQGVLMIEELTPDIIR